MGHDAVMTSQLTSVQAAAALFTRGNDLPFSPSPAGAFTRVDVAGAAVLDLSRWN
jgi:hypothetical protein